MLIYRFRLYGSAFFELIKLLVFVIIITFEFSKSDKLSRYLMIPYILWVVFAGILSYTIWILNM
ncbi:tryptophan-rich sensory protein [Clostridiaceae bacterium UIB06]|uniref:Tryptophan-rich sensory protein n=1 Tax=Clostridium thailandense TaxID=2794346 RepID=A0A949TUW1_9CLOT|nr:TspO/MBR family protein [Clostridium thailandense]MBV7276917.1 tryptophan-rich sensory protein [Clostridium thailandense]MCH5138376.1 tryptophan-rich sensory protein [Clostridiaceae bacterium UIB06]